MLKYLNLIIIFIFCSATVWAQKNTPKVIVPEQEFMDSIIVIPTDSGFVFKPHLRPLQQVAGAPEPFYSYFWELGDGHFSTAKQPLHSYTGDKEYEVRLWATNHYHDGKRPPTKPVKVRGQIKTKPQVAYNYNKYFDDANQLIFLKNNADPKPGETMVCVMGYRYLPTNTNTNTPVAGTLVLMHNEKIFSNKNFELADTRLHHNEKESDIKGLTALLENISTVENDWIGYAYNGPQPAEPQMPTGIKNARETFTTAFKTKMSGYENVNSWRTAELANNNTSLIFFELATTPEMIKDTNATVVITAAFIPDDPSMGAEMLDLEMQIVASHDPNRMKVSRNRLNYRWVSQSKKLKYTIQFQNTGKGPAKRIELQTQLPSYLNANSIQVLKQYPECKPCSEVTGLTSCLDKIVKGDTVYFIFKNIYLPGTTQDGVKDMDSTKGFVTFDANFIKRTKKKDFAGRTAIVFDKNPPIITNFAKTRFKPGLSPGMMIGYYSFPGQNLTQFAKESVENLQGEKQFTLGFSISRYSSFKPYLQAELWLRYQPEQATALTRVETSQTIYIPYNGREHRVVSHDRYYKIKGFYNDAYLLARHSLNNFIGAELGVAGALLIKGNYEEYSKLVLVPVNAAGGEFTIDTLRSSVSKTAGFFQPAVVAGINIGKVRSGPSVGVRYLHYFQRPNNRFQLYAIWKL